MYNSFYTATSGMCGQQTKMDVVANNLANVSTTGYKTKNAVFSEIMYTNLNASATANTHLKAGDGTRVKQVNTDFSQGGLNETGNADDYAISGEGFFMIENPSTGEISYTRDGSFIQSTIGNKQYLATAEGKLVLDKNQQPIEMQAEGIDANGNTPDIGIYEFTLKDGMQNIGNNEFQPVAKNGTPVLSTSAELKQGYLEDSNVDVASEMSKVIEAQRAYSYSMKMVETSDEITSTINSLRG